MGDQRDHPGNTSNGSSMQCTSTTTTAWILRFNFRSSQKKPLADPTGPHLNISTACYCLLINSAADIWIKEPSNNGIKICAAELDSVFTKITCSVKILLQIIDYWSSDFWSSNTISVAHPLNI